MKISQILTKEIFKFFIVLPIEKTYIEKIDQELNENVNNH